ncbi:nuclear transport factor 2 family protein [Humitalea sp. 24SJ18S-53]|uniref:nuclear transport factor 2 family protein n=1 Tax=Humitalea sp. 24SJ18S-53 TaxID=3422307 RepID=UPI003D670B17
MTVDILLRAALVTTCQQAVLRFFSALDGGRWDEVAGSLAEDGVWHRQGKALRGPDAVRAAMADRPAGRVTAHLVQNLVIELDGERAATARFMALTFRHDGGTPAPIGLPLSIAAYADRMRRDGDTWLVVERRGIRVFG